MAASGRINGSCSGSSGSKYNFWVDWEESNVSQSGNNSRITFWLRVKRNDGVANSAWNRNKKPSVTLKIDGQAVALDELNYIDTRNNATCTFGVYYTIRAHNEDGSKSLSVAASFTMYDTPTLTGGSLSGAANLTTILRQSTLKSVPAITIGQPATVAISAPVSSWTHTLKLTFGGVTITKSLGAGGASVTLTAAETARLAAAIPNANIGRGTMTLTNSVGVSTAADFTANIDVPAASPKWSGAFAFADITHASITGDNQKIISGISDIRITIPAAAASAQQSAGMVKYIASCGNVTGSAAYSATDAVTIILQDVSAAQITVAAVDSRGNQTVVSKTAEVIPYAPPVIRSLTARRVNGSTAEVVLDLAASIYADPIGATANAVQSLSYTYTPDGGDASDAIRITPAVSGGTVRFSASIQGDIGTGGFVIKNSYTITVTLADKLASATMTAPLNSGIVIMDLYRSGDTYGVGVGALYEPDVTGRLQVDGKQVPTVEYGTWTPSILLGDWTYTEQTGIWARVGDLVHISVVIRTARGTVHRHGIIVSVPFAPASGKQCYFAGISDVKAEYMGHGRYFRVDPEGSSWVRCGIEMSETWDTLVTHYLDTAGASIQFSGWYCIA